MRVVHLYMSDTSYEVLYTLGKHYKVRFADHVRHVSNRPPVSTFTCLLCLYNQGSLEHNNLTRLTCQRTLVAYSTLHPDSDNT